MVDGLEGLECLLAVSFVDIDDHVADVIVGLQVLAGDVNAVFGQYAVNLRQYARHVVVNMQQTVLLRGGQAAPLRGS